MTILIWHMLDEPSTPEAMQSTLPLPALDTAYLALPAIENEPQDFLLDVFAPIVDGAVRSFQPQKDAVLIGASVSALVALELAAQGHATAVVLISPATQLGALVEANAAAYGMTYEWSEASREIADRLDFVARAKEIDVPVLIVSGEEDPLAPQAEQLWQALPAGLASLVKVPGMGHSPTSEVNGIVAEWLGRQGGSHPDKPPR